MRWWPRSIRRQVLLGLVLLEAVSMAVFALLLVRLDHQMAIERAQRRLVHQAASLALDAEQALQHRKVPAIRALVDMMGESPSVRRARITDPVGNMLYVSGSEPEESQLDSSEISQIPLARNGSLSFQSSEMLFEAAAPIYVGKDLRGFAWIESDPQWDNEQTDSILRRILTFGAAWILFSILLAGWFSRSIGRPLAILNRGTRALMSSPESTSTFPLPVTGDDEFGQLIQAFNSMVASIQEQRGGLNDTLALLDSMLANAPIGLAFFDRYLHFVRVNQIFAGYSGLALGRHIGRTPGDLLSQEVSKPLESAIERVFEAETPIAEVEISGHGENGREFTWLVSAYPVHTALHQVRWVGIIVRDVSERIRAEEALRRTEKLAATGRLASSIAHEINNPLEAVTNLLFLLREFSGLGEPALQYVAMAEHEVRRISEIAQQTLRFYRQSTQPLRVNPGQLIDSVLELYKGRIGTLGILVERRYEPEATLLCFEGELRQVLANLVGNSIDASSSGARLMVRVRRSQAWSLPGKQGVRITVADTGCGMTPEVRNRIFEAFFTTKDATGTGLGLWVSQEIVQKHGGRMAVRSRATAADVRSGTVFQLFVPDGEQLGTSSQSDPSIPRQE